MTLEQIRNRVRTKEEILQHNLIALNIAVEFLMNDLEMPLLTSINANRIKYIEFCLAEGILYSSTDFEKFQRVNGVGY